MNLDDIKFGNPPKEQDDKVKADRAGILIHYFGWKRKPKMLMV